ncbi:MAG: hypothetical protein GYB67_04230 [Chloroflexi bacterium]|nr:hypothetical protein [Chloroflexota bacterium]
MDALLVTFLELTNETLATAIVVVAASLLLYNLTRNYDNWVARTSAVVLGCVMVGYVADVLISLGPGRATFEALLRFQWLGIAFIPVALYHLSDALLATTGLPSRGRRRRVIRILYIIAAQFLILAAFTDVLIQPVPVSAEIPEVFSGQGVLLSLRGGPIFPIYTIYFVIVTLAAFINVQRARLRCLTRSTRRRMGYLQIAFLTPAIGLFPFSVLLGPGDQYSLLGLFVVNLANIFVILMLLFLAYPLSFFGSRIPDRVVKTELLSFLLRGPATGLLALVTILFTNSATRIIGLAGESFMPFAVVAVVLLWQWGIAIGLPFLEKRLVYADEDDDQLDKLRHLSERVLTRRDLQQLMNTVLEATCDYLRVNTAFVVNLNDGEPELIGAVGPTRPTGELLKDEFATVTGLLVDPAKRTTLALQTWHSYWIAPLYSQRNVNGTARLIGFMGIQARAAQVDLTTDELEMFGKLSRRAARALDDMTLQGEIFAALEGLLPQINITRSRAAELEYSPPRTPLPKPAVEDEDQFTDQVRAALRHYWGGPGLTSSRLLELRAVQGQMPDHDNNAVKALRAVLTAAIEAQKPEGERKYMSPEWTLYNILDLRFIQKAKVREVATRLALSEPDLYRKQRIAIRAVAHTLIDWENGSDDRS